MTIYSNTLKSYVFISSYKKCWTIHDRSILPFGYMNTWIYKYMNIMLYGYMDMKIYGYMVSYTYGYMDI